MPAVVLNRTARFAVLDLPGVAQAAAPAAAPTRAAAPGAAGASAVPEPEESKREYRVSDMSLEERYAVCRVVGEECIQEAELMRLLEVKQHPICYDGFEPSGRMHIAQGLMRCLNVNRLTSAGCVFKFWVADWFAMLNNKMGGDLRKIRKVGEYFIQVWTAAGMDMTNVEFLWASDHINGNADEYWKRVMNIATTFNLNRMQRCCTIMGRSDGSEMSAAQILYPAMQCADIFYLKADICQLGMDQRKVNMLAREYCDSVKPKIKHKPIILSHHMLLGLKEGQEKMSKSDPDSAIFMEDTSADVRRKIKRAFCPPGVAENNPILDYTKHLWFPLEGTAVIPRSEDNGGSQVYATYEELEAAYVSGEVHPGDLKAGLTAFIDARLEPVRQHFASGAPKKLLAEIKKFKVTK